MNLVYTVWISLTIIGIIAGLILIIKDKLIKNKTPMNIKKVRSAGFFTLFMFFLSLSALIERGFSIMFFIFFFWFSLGLLMLIYEIKSKSK